MAKISNDVMKLLEEIAEMAAIKALRKKSTIRPGTNYFKLTEKILHQYQDLKYYLEDEENYIEKYLSEDKPRKSKDIVVFTSSIGNHSVVDATAGAREKAKESLRLSKAFVARIDMALSRLEPEHNEIVTALYFNKIEKADDIANRLHIDRTTLFRRKKKVIEKIGIFLFGSITIDV